MYFTHIFRVDQLTTSFIFIGGTRHIRVDASVFPTGEYIHPEDKNVEKQWERANGKVNSVGRGRQLRCGRVNCATEFLDHLSDLFVRPSSEIDPGNPENYNN